MRVRIELPSSEPKRVMARMIKTLEQKGFDVIRHSATSYSITDPRSEHPEPLEVSK
jgi:hypothetical protein